MEGGRRTAFARMRPPGQQGEQRERVRGLRTMHGRSAILDVASPLLRHSRSLDAASRPASGKRAPRLATRAAAPDVTCSFGGVAGNAEENERVSALMGTHFRRGMV